MSAQLETPVATAIHQPQLIGLGPFRERANALTPNMREADRPFFTSVASGIELGYWEGTEGGFPARRDGYTEMCHIIAGHATLHTEGAEPIELRAGDTVAMPSGWVGRWELHEPTRKLYITVDDR
ncbi:cupin domain-containing protein [Leucobacter sp. HY1910]